MPGVVDFSEPPPESAASGVVEVNLTGGSQATAIGAVRQALERNVPLTLVPAPMPVDSLAISDAPGLTIYTSGTTGDPKPVGHSWDTLLANVSSRGSPTERWLLTYSLARFAGVQVLMHCLRHGAGLIVPDDLRHLRGLVEAGRIEGATHLSATPSLLRRLLMAGATDALADLRQITLGGEYATQSVLDSARRGWPRATITAIYASTEVGACYSMSDGLAGIPAAKLPNGIGGRRGRLAHDGELHVTLPDGREHPTGDLFQIRDGRACFIGRREEIVNVGGHKVSPVRVEEAIREMAGVDDCIVYGRANALLGHVLVCDYTGSAQRAEVQAWCRRHLASAERPATVRHTDDLELTAAGKVERRRR